MQFLPNFALSFYIYKANSLVGASTNTIGPSPFLTGGYAVICTIPGRRKAPVFPDPVLAIPIKSLPDSIIGNAFYIFYLYYLGLKLELVKSNCTPIWFSLCNLENECRPSL